MQELRPSGCKLYLLAKRSSFPARMGETYRFSRISLRQRLDMHAHSWGALTIPPSTAPTTRSLSGGRRERTSHDRVRCHLAFWLLHRGLFHLPIRDSIEEAAVLEGLALFTFLTVLATVVGMLIGEWWEGGP